MSHSISEPRRYALHSIFIVLLAFVMLSGCRQASAALRIGVFKVNATPPIGRPVAYARARSVADSLWAKGFVLMSDEKPIVVCAVDWLGIANEGLEEWKTAIATAAGTTVDRVSVHGVHQHDGCRCDFTTARILRRHGLGGWRYDTVFMRSTVAAVSAAVRRAVQRAEPVTHLGFGKARVEKVASNRRILGEDGRVAIVRWSKTTDPAAIAAPEGLIDPWLRSVSFWRDDHPHVVLHYYATHPMSHYGLGDVSSDFVGIARERLEKSSGVPQIYFTGAAGNITAGKYNDGSPERRYVLAGRIQTAMEQAWDDTRKIKVGADDVQWRHTGVLLPPGRHLREQPLKSVLADAEADSLKKFTAAKHLAWLDRTQEGFKTRISSLRIGNVYLLHLPGEAFIEYQLAAQELKPGYEVCTAAYEEYGPGYICTEVAYSQGGYESSHRASRVSPEVERVMMGAIEFVLH